MEYREQLTFNKLREFIFGRVIFLFYEFHLTNVNCGWENPHQIYSERYRNEDAQMLEEFIENMDINPQFTMEGVEKRIKDGHIFYVAKKGGEIIGYCWYFVNKVNIPWFKATLYLKPDEVCSLNSYIKPEFRGKGIRNNMRAYEYAELNKKGYKRSVTYVHHVNKATIRMHKKWGSVHIGVLRRIRILTLTFDYTNITSDKINFHSGPFLLWKRMYHIIKNAKFKK